MGGADEGQRARHSPAQDCPYVSEELDARSLHFSMSQTQSRMQLRRPDVLDLEYTCTMMGFLMWRPQPRRLAMIGLGGGSLAKFCYRHLTRADMIAIEINPQVVALRDVFQVPPDGARFRVVCDDGADFVARTTERFDALLVDGFDAQGMPARLGAPRFYDDCVDVLQPGGVLVANLHAGDPLVDVYIERIRQSSGSAVVRVDDSDAGNTVVFALKAGGDRPMDAVTARRPDGLAPAAWEQLRAAYARVAAAARAGEPTGYDNAGVRASTPR